MNEHSPPPARPPDPDHPAAGSGREPDAGAADTSPAEPAQQISELTQRITELEDQRLRALADLDNLRKRCAGQVSAARAETRAEVAARWLPVVDNLERALDHAQADPGSIVEGIRAVLEQAMGVLSQLGFPRRDDLGTPFDPARHEAIAAVSEADAPAGSVIDVVRPAYGEGDRQLRPAQVVVARDG
ncbi:MAG TPA: nucleotide exchange factor GrpE [Streptosporangiaceae bacterium]|nr:nucleotide exchange factor GrpE [Streptosporangiaceae bacterium]